MKRDSLSLRYASLPPRPLSWLVFEAVITASPPSLLVEASLMHHDLYEDFDHCASILPMPLSWLVIEATIVASPPILVEVSLMHHDLVEDFDH